MGQAGTTPTALVDRVVSGSARRSGGFIAPILLDIRMSAETLQQVLESSDNAAETFRDNDLS